MVGPDGRGGLRDWPPRWPGPHRGLHPALAGDAPLLGGGHAEAPHIGPLWTEMLPGGPAPLTHHDGAWIIFPHRLLARWKNGLLGSTPVPLKFDVPPVPGSG